ncbi:MAG: hypothetical protein RL179_77 [Planctomycetota bacterium]|jgi:hypothetical protein
MAYRKVFDPNMDSIDNKPEGEKEVSEISGAIKPTHQKRSNSDRRKEFIPVVVERRTGLDRRIESEKRRMVDPVTFEKEYNGDEVAFMNAMDQYKRSNRRPFPTWSEVLEVLVSLGYRKVADPAPLPGLPVKIEPKDQL